MDTGFRQQEALPAVLLPHIGAGKAQQLFSVTSPPCELWKNHLSILENGKRYTISHGDVKASQEAVRSCLWWRCLHLR